MLLMAGDGGGHETIPNLFEMASENRLSYADHWGYRFNFQNITKYNREGVAHVWGKIFAVKDAFALYPDIEWVFLLDMDAIIMKQDYDLYKKILSDNAMQEVGLKGVEMLSWKGGKTGIHMPDEFNSTDISLIIAQDQNGLNTGSMFFRRGTFMDNLLDIWTDPDFLKKEWPGLEQDVLVS